VFSTHAYDLVGFGTKHQQGVGVWWFGGLVGWWFGGLVGWWVGGWVVVVVVWVWQLSCVVCE